MGNWLQSVLKTTGPRIIGALVSGVAGYVLTHTKGAVSIDPAQTAEVVTAMLVAYAASHRATSSVVNPGDSAKGRVADAIKDASETGTTVKVAHKD